MSDYPGFGVMIGMLGSNEDTVAALKESIGKEIANVRIDDEANHGDGALLIGLSDGSVLSLYDAGRSCCESRYMKADDDLEYHVGATLQGAEVRDGPTEDGEYGYVHETAFLHVTTSKGVMVVNTHNEHNGYYGGFWFEACLQKKATA